MLSYNIKIIICIILMLVSVVIFSKSKENRKMAWLRLPSILSIIAFVMWAIVLTEDFLINIQ